jgi:hypothetical protein
MRDDSGRLECDAVPKTIGDEIMSKRVFLLLCLLGVAIGLPGCRSDSARAKPPGGVTRVEGTPIPADALPEEVAAGQTVYVPVYSNIYSRDERRTFELTVTLSVRNTDLQNPIILTSVRYYDTHGALIREYLETPLRLAALASTDFVVGEKDTVGGSGANFIVDWIAGSTVSEPVIEAVMIGAMSQQGISFRSPGRVISQR